MPKTTVHSQEKIWRTQYRLRPYLGNASVEELQARMEDVLRNLLTFTREGKIGVTGPKAAGPMWAQRLVDLQVECERRRISVVELGSVIRRLQFNPSALEIVQGNLHAFDLKDASGVLCKYGERRWMRNLLERGEMRLSAASYYRGNDHNAARQDDELQLPVFVSPYDYDLGLISPIIRQLRPTRSWHRFSVHKPNDHYLYCLTASFDPRFFFDFAKKDNIIAESCVVIRNYDTFKKRLLHAASQKLPGWRIRFGAVRYTDPYFLVDRFPAEPEVYHYKSFRFLYQREHRLTAVPPPSVKIRQTHVYLTLGSLRDIAEMIEMDNLPT